MVHYTYNDIINLNIDGYTDHGYNENLKLVLKWFDPDKSSSYDNWIDILEYKNEINKCVCGHDIEIVFRIQHITLNITLDIGSSCISKFSENIKKKIDHINRKRLILKKDSQSKFCYKCDNKLSNTDTFVKLNNEVHYFHKTCFDNYDQDNEVMKAIERKKNYIEIKKEFKKVSEYTLYFGKYKNMSLQSIYKIDKKYLYWCRDNLPHKPMVSYRIDFLLKYAKPSNTNIEASS